MEPIRPDHDEVAARHSDKEPRGRSVNAGDPGRASRQPSKTGGSGRASVGSVIPVILLAVLILLGGWFLVRQHQTIEQLQADVSESEDWISRTKLSMARFEGRLSEADRELLESGSEITEKLQFLDSEMRKLWGVSNDRNRKAIKANQEAVGFLEDKTDYLDKQRAELSGLLAEQQSRSETALQELQALRDEVSNMQSQQEELIAEMEVAREADRSLTAAQEDLQGRISSIAQRQSLGTDELRARLSAVEQRVAASDNQAALSQLEQQLGELKEVVDSIDASRSQLTGRLLRLEQRLQGGAGQ